METSLRGKKNVIQIAPERPTVLIGKRALPPINRRPAGETGEKYRQSWGVTGSPAPQGVTVERRADALQIVRRWRSKAAIGLAVSPDRTDFAALASSRSLPERRADHQ